MIVCQICYLAKRSDLEKVDFCTHSIDFCKICLLNNRQVGFRFSLDLTSKIDCKLNFWSMIKIFEMVIACWISDTAKKSDLKKVYFCSCNINFCKISWSRIAKKKNNIYLEMISNVHFKLKNFLIVRERFKKEGRMHFGLHAWRLWLIGRAVRDSVRR